MNLRSQLYRTSVNSFIFYLQKCVVQSHTSQNWIHLCSRYRYTLISSLGYLTLCQVSRVFIFDYGVLSTDFSGWGHFYDVLCHFDHERSTVTLIQCKQRRKDGHLRLFFCLNVPTCQHGHWKYTLLGIRCETASHDFCGGATPRGLTLFLIYQFSQFSFAEVFVHTLG